MKPQADEERVEKLLTFRAAADALGIPYYKIQRAASAGLLPTYRLLNGRRLLKLSDLRAVIDATREGGGQ
jgi:hypothetical protein